MGSHFSDRLLRTALRKGYLDRNRVAAARKLMRGERAAGGRPRLHRILLRYNLLTRAQLLDIRRTMARQGMPMRVGDFDIISRLGRGAAGAVYRARQRSLDREVAIKILAGPLAADGELVERFLHEARAAAQICHPNVVQVYDVGRTQHTRYIVMEYVRGPTLDRVLRAEGPISEERAVAIGVQAARALVTTEGAGIVHRDIKPANIIVTPSGTAKLADLGLALVPGETVEHSAGTPYYMAPEQARGQADLDTRADIYALGCTLFHAVTGRAPYRGRTAAETLRMHAEAAVPDAGDARPARAGAPLSPAFRATLKRMMAKAPDARFATAADLLAALSCGEEEDTPPPLPGPKPRVRRGLLPWAFVAAGALGVIALAAIALIVTRTASQADEPPDPPFTVVAPETPPPDLRPSPRPRRPRWRR